VQRENKKFSKASLVKSIQYSKSIDQLWKKKMHSIPCVTRPNCNVVCKYLASEQIFAPKQYQWTRLFFCLSKYAD